MVLNSFSEYTAFTNGSNHAYFQWGKDTNSWYVSDHWDPEAGEEGIICMIGKLTHVLFLIHKIYQFKLIHYYILFYGLLIN